MGDSVAEKRAVSEIFSRTAVLFLFYLFIFVVSAAVGYWLGGGISGEDIFIPLPDVCSADISERIRYFCTVLRGTLLQCLLLFIGGLSVRPMVVPCALSLYRGYCFGYVLSLQRMALLYTHAAEETLLSYFAASVFLLLFAAWAAVRLQCRLSQIHLRHLPGSRIYLFLFLSLSGIVFLLYCIPFFIT